MIRRVGVLLLTLVAVGAVLTATSRGGDAAREDLPARLSSRDDGAPMDAVTTADASPRPVPRSERPLAPDGSRPVSHRSARIEDIEETPRPRPSRLRIAALGIDAAVVALGVAPTGAMEVPSDADTVAWYAYGPSPAQPGSAVLAAHVDYNGRKGVFFRLGDLRAGDVVIVDFADGGSRTFVVRERASVAKEALPVEELFRREGRPILTLITCGGDFNPATRSYRNNVIVRAVPTDLGRLSRVPAGGSSRPREGR